MEKTYDKYAWCSNAEERKLYMDMDKRREEERLELQRVSEMEKVMKLNDVAPNDSDTEVLSFVVTPGMEVCPNLLQQLPCDYLLKKKNKLIDEGGLFPEAKQTNIIKDAHENGFVAAAVEAFSRHYPLVLSPTHFWMMILQGVSLHVGENSEEVRSKWVNHEGKMQLVCRVDDFTLGQPNDWSSCVDGRPDSFSKQISKTIVEGLEDQLLPKISKITPAENIALKVTVMEACKNFYAYINCTCCGYPSIDMEGSDADWILLGETAKSLVTERCTKDFSEWWLDSLLPLLDKIVQERKNIKSGQACD